MWQFTENETNPFINADEALINASKRFKETQDEQLKLNTAIMKEIQDNIHEVIKIASDRGKTHTVYHIPYTSPVRDAGYHVYYELCNAIIVYLSNKGYKVHIKRNESKCGICQHILHI